MNEKLSMNELLDILLARPEIEENTEDDFITEVKSLFDKYDADVDDKITALVIFAKHINYASCKNKELSEKFDQRGKRLMRKSTNIREYAKDCMILLGKEKISSDTATISICSNSTPKYTYDTDKIPSKYKEIEYKPDKDKIKEALGKGEEIPGCSVEVNNTKYLRVGIM